MYSRPSSAASAWRLTAHWLRFPSMSAFILGCLFPLGFAPFNFWPVSIISLAGYYGLLQHLRNQPNTRFKNLFINSFSYCVGLFSVGVSWIHISIYVYGESPLVVSLLLTGAMIFVMSLMVSLVMALSNFSKTPPLNALLFASLWVLGEIVRSMVLTGFPWLLLGYAFIDSPLVGFAPMVGVYGLSFLIALCAAWLANTFFKHRTLQQRLRYMAGILILFSGGYLLNFQQWTQPLAANINVALIQGNIDQRIKWDESEQQNTLAIYRQLTEQWLNSSRENNHQTTIMVWPEAAIPLFYHEAEAYIQQMSQILTAANISWITGIPTEDDDGEYAQYFNSVIAAGVGSGRYNKQKLVPFGEFIPFPDIIRAIGQALQWPIFDLPMSSFTVGDRHQSPLLANQYRIAPFICYEIVYPDLVRAAAANSDLLLTISNDGWFGDSIAPHQHFEMARMRAIETGKMLIRSTNTGISGLIDHRGQVIMQMPSFQRTYGTGQVHPTQGQTPFMRIGNTPLYIGILVLLMFNFRHLLLKSRGIPWKRNTKST